MLVEYTSLATYSDYSTRGKHAEYNHTALALYRLMTYGIMRLMFLYDQYDAEQHHECLPDFTGFPRKIGVYYALYMHVTAHFN